MSEGLTFRRANSQAQTLTSSISDLDIPIAVGFGAVEVTEGTLLTSGGTPVGSVFTHPNDDLWLYALSLGFQGSLGTKLYVTLQESAGDGTQVMAECSLTIADTGVNVVSLSGVIPGSQFQDASVFVSADSTGLVVRRRQLQIARVG